MLSIFNINFVDRKKKTKQRHRIVDGTEARNCYGKRNGEKLACEFSFQLLSVVAFPVAVAVLGRSVARKFASLSLVPFPTTLRPSPATATRKGTRDKFTRCQIFHLKCIKFNVGWGSALDPAGELSPHDAPPCQNPRSATVCS